MVKRLAIVLTSLFLSCQPPSDKQEDATTKPEIIPIGRADENKREPLKKYAHVSQLIESTGDYSASNGTFKVLSQKPLHIQLAKPTVEGEAEKAVREQVKRNIIHIGFRTFAQTDVNEIQITSVPLKWEGEKSKDFDYIQTYMQTVTLTREKAKALLEKYYGHADFTKLFGDEMVGTYFPEVPNKELKKMLFNDQGEPTLDKTFAQLQ